MTADTTRNGVVVQVAAGQKSRRSKARRPSGPSSVQSKKRRIDAAVGGAVALVGALDRELAVGQRLAGHLDAAEAARLEHGVELDLGAEDLLHAADVLVAVRMST